MGTESVPKMGTECVPKMGTESVPKMGTPSQNASGLAFWPPGQPPKVLGLSLSGNGVRPHFGYGFRPHFRVRFRPHVDHGSRPDFWRHIILGRIFNLLLAFILGFEATRQIRQLPLELEEQIACFDEFSLKRKWAPA